MHIRETNRNTDREIEDVVEAVCGDMAVGAKGGGEGSVGVNVNRETNRMTAKQIKSNTTMK